MDKEKEIEEMAKVLCIDNVECKHCPSRGFSKERCGIIKVMRLLQENGYGNIEQAVIEFRKEIATRTVYEAGDTGIECVSLSDIDKLIKERFGKRK